MDTLFKGVVLVIGLVIKLVITGICLAIGFKLGYVIYDKAEEYRKKKLAKAMPEATPVAV